MNMAKNDLRMLHDKSLLSIRNVVYVQNTGCIKNVPISKNSSYSDISKYLGIFLFQLGELHVTHAKNLCGKTHQKLYMS